jgi:hypothetical protein
VPCDARSTSVTSVSWNLLIGRNPLLVAKEHGHRLTTMLSVYAAWTEGAVETDIAAIRDAMNRTDGIRRKTARDRPGTGMPTPTPAGQPVAPPDGRSRTRRTEVELAWDDLPPERRFGSRFGSSLRAREAKLLKTRENFGGKGGTRSNLLMSLDFLSPQIPLDPRFWHSIWH